MSKVFAKFFITLFISLGIFSVAETASAWNGNCRWVPGHWQNGYWQPGKRVCWERGWRNDRWQRPGRNCYWVNGHWRHGVWYPGQRVCRW